MPRATPKSKSSRLRALPWAAMLQVGVVVGRRIGELPDKDRARLAVLVRKSKGWPGGLATKEREELRRLIGKLDAKSMSRELLPLIGGSRRGRKRR